MVSLPKQFEFPVMRYFVCKKNVPIQLNNIETKISKLKEENSAKIRIFS
jgi:hypothetical protein